jgi:glycine betaine/proline transport system substrate-binding protein
VFLGWEPHPMNSEFKIRYLEGGDDVFGPNLGGATIYTNTRADYATECPNVGKFLKNLAFTLGMENEIMGAILFDKVDADKAAVDWLKKSPTMLDGWLKDVTTIDGKPGLPAVKTSLGVGEANRRPRGGIGRRADGDHEAVCMEEWLTGWKLPSGAGWKPPSAR